MRKARLIERKLAKMLSVVLRKKIPKHKDV